MIHGSKIVQRLWSSAKCVQFMSDSAVTVLYAWNEKSGWKIFQFSTSELHLPYKQQGSSTTFEICGSIQLSQCLEGFCTSTRTSCQAQAHSSSGFYLQKKIPKIDWLSFCPKDSTDLLTLSTIYGFLKSKQLAKKKFRAFFKSPFEEMFTRDSKSSGPNHYSCLNF